MKAFDHSTSSNPRLSAIGSLTSSRRKTSKLAQTHFKWCKISCATFSMVYLCKMKSVPFRSSIMISSNRQRRLERKALESLTPNSTLYSAFSRASKYSPFRWSRHLVHHGILLVQGIPELYAKIKRTCSYLSHSLAIRCKQQIS